MPKQTIEVDESLIPPGYVLAGEYRCALPDEPFLAGTGNARVLHCNDLVGLLQPRIILRRKEPVRESEYASVYRFAICGISQTRAGCDARADLDSRQGVIRLDYENNKLVAVTLEPLGEGGGDE